MSSQPISAAEFTKLVHAHVEPVVAQAGFAWNVHHRTTDEDRQQSVLFEAEPDEFAQRYVHLMSDYGRQQVPCIDLWIKRLPSGQGLDVTLESVHLVPWLHKKGQQALAIAIEGNVDLGESIRALARGLELLFDERGEKPWT